MTWLKISTISCLLGISAAAAEAPPFISVSPENVFMSDGSELPEDLTTLGWQWNPDEGNGGIFESVSAKPLLLMTQVDGLEAGAVYEVFGYFWADGYGTDHPDTRNQCPAQFGLSLATIHTFDGPGQPTRDYVSAWEVTPSGDAGKAYGLSASILEIAPPNVEKIRYEEARLVQARMGYLHADHNGTLPVFFGSYPYWRPLGPTWIDGVAVRKVEKEGPLEQGWKENTWLHLALRAGDSVTIKRELERGGDINALDEENLTPLYYACTADDVELVKKLLELGADPNFPTQSLAPLSVAAKQSSEDIVKVLLDAGAEVPLKIAEKPPALAKLIHPGNVHPVICAIKSGSLPILKMMLEKQPDLDIASLLNMEDIELGKGRSVRAPHSGIVVGAIELEQWEMAEFLLDTGFTDFGHESSHHRLLVKCCYAGEPAMPVFEKLIKLGVKPVVFKSRSRHGGDENGFGRKHDADTGEVQPFDALTAAVYCENLELTNRFLPEARYAPATYIDTLALLAVYTRNEAICDAIQKQYRRVMLNRWVPGPKPSDEEVMREEDLRVFLPRTTPPPESSAQKTGEKVIGVIASPGAQDAGISLSAIASTKEGWKAVDRELVENAIFEGHINKPWMDGQHDLSSLGDKLSADVLAIVSEIKSDGASLYAFEMLEVATGLVCHREHILSKDFKPENDLSAMLERTSRALDAASRNERRQAITLLSFSSRGDLPNELALGKLLHGVIQTQVDTNPGLISLTRSQSARLVEEQVLQGKNSVWGAAHLIEGSISAADDRDQIKVALRLETLGANRSSVKTDAEATGSIHDAKAVIIEAWNKLCDKAENKLINKSEEIDPASQAIANEEANRLLKEAEWLMDAKIAPERARNLIESASALGANHRDLVRIHLDFLFRQITSMSCQYLDKPDTAKSLHNRIRELNHLPVALNLSDRMANELPLARELLHQTGFYFDLYGEKNLAGRRTGNHRGNEFWLVINALSFYRAALYEDYLPEGTREDYKILCSELDALTDRYYEELNKADELNVGRTAILTGGHYWILKRNPSLHQGIVNITQKVNRISDLLPRDFNKHLGGSKFAEEIIETLKDDNSPKAELFKADLECYLANASKAPDATRAFVYAAETGNRHAMYKLGNSTSVTNKRVNTYSTASWFSWAENGSAVLPTLVHHPRPAPDAFGKAHVYLNTNFYRHGIPHPIDTRWYRIGSSKDSYDRNMSRALSEKNAERLQSLLNALPLHHMYSGHNHVPTLGKRYRPSLEQMLQSHPTHKAVSGKLIADLRNHTNPTPGSSRYFLRDRINPDLVWIFYYSSAAQSLGVNDYGGTVSYSAKPTTFQSIWLIGLNCKTGEVLQSINLSRETLKAVGSNALPRAIGPIDLTPGQNDNAIITNMRLLADDRSFSYRNDTRIVIINKDTGKVECLDEGLKISDRTATETHAVWHNVAGLKDEFYFIDQRGFDLASNKNKSLQERSLATVYRVGPDMQAKPLVVQGRRPAISPFDGIDTLPTELINQDDRLLVYNGNLHAHFDPQDNSWEVIKDHHTKFGYKMYHFAKRVRQNHMDPIHSITLNGKDTGWRVNFEQLKPDKLWCIHDELGTVELSVNLDIPNDFKQNTTIFINKVTPPQNGVAQKSEVLGLPYDEYTKERPMHTVVLNQTDDDLILGYQAGSGLRWRRPSRYGLHLPFFWKVSKKDIVETLNQVADKE